MMVMVAVQEVHPAVVMEVERAVVRVRMVEVERVVPLNAVSGREEREKVPVAAAGYRVEEGVEVPVEVLVEVPVGVLVGVSVEELVRVPEGVLVGVTVRVFVGVRVPVEEGEGEGVGLSLGEGL